MLKLEQKFDSSKDKEYKIEAIRDSATHIKAVKSQLPGSYYLVSWKDYLENENPWEQVSAVMHLQKMISNFCKNYHKNCLATSPPLNSTFPMTRPTIQLKQKRARIKPGNTVKWAKKTSFWIF